MKLAYTLTVAALLGGAIAPAMAQPSEPAPGSVADQRSDHREDNAAVNAAARERNHDRAMAAERRVDSGEAMHRREYAAAGARARAQNRANRARANEYARDRNRAHAQAVDHQVDVQQAERRGDPTHVPQ